MKNLVFDSKKSVYLEGKPWFFMVLGAPGKYLFRKSLDYRLPRAWVSTTCKLLRTLKDLKSTPKHLGVGQKYRVPEKHYW